MLKIMQAIISTLGGLMSSTVSVLDSIPSAAWGVVGAIVAATLISITNIISNIGNNKRLSLQLAHDAKEKNIDRMTNLRREIYLAAVAEMTSASSYFGSLPHRDSDDQNIAAGLEGLYVAAAKLSLVAPSGTQEAVDALGVEYWKLTHKVIMIIAPIQKVKAEVELYKGMYDQAMLEVKRLMGVMSSLQESGTPNENVILGVKESFDLFSDKASEYAKKKHEANKKFYALCSEYNVGLMRDMKPLAVLQAKVVIAIRGDFGIETDEARMMAHMEQQWKTVSDAVGLASSP